jgi:spore germination cell wall hydrolase CwlJ-like protein
MHSDQDITTMALTVWGEARGETREGQKGVAWVIRNRYENPGWWSRQRGDGIADDTIEAVCRDPFQFSCWNPADPNRSRLNNPKTQERDDYKAIHSLCLDVLNASYDDDPTDGSDHYCTKAVVRHTRWARRRTPTKVIGNHFFFKIGLLG